MEKLQEQLINYWELHQTALFVIIIIVAAVILSRVVRLFLNKFIEDSTAFIKVDATRYRFIKNAVNFVIILVAFILIIYQIPKFKTLAVSLFAGAGILAAFLGFASQQAFSNIVSGIFIVIFKPFRVGDFIKIGNEILGEVEDITLRHTVINGLENRRIVMPNSTISSETIVNSSITDSKICRFVVIGISYDSDLDKAIRIIQEEAMKHPDCMDNRTAEEKEQGVPQVIVRVINFLDSAVQLRAYVWAKDSATAFVMNCDLNYSIKKRFDTEGIEIPFPHRTLVYKNQDNQALPPQAKGKLV